MSQIDKNTAPLTNPAATTGERQKSRPTETLPTDRIAFGKQIGLLLAYAGIYDQTGQPVTNAEAGRAVSLSASTTSLANAFFADVGFLTRADNGYTPTLEVLNFYRVHGYDPDSAGRELAQVLNGTWFAATMIPRLAVGPVTEPAAIAELAKRANASPHYRPQLRMLIDYLVTAGLIEQDGDQLRRPGGGAPERSPSKDEVEMQVRGQQTTGFHPFVQGLLEVLPPPGSVWSRQAQEDWIEGWRVAFKFLYKPDPGSSTEGDAAEVRLNMTPSGTEG
jgi:hypothetical protein